MLTDRGAATDFDGTDAAVLAGVTTLHLPAYSLTVEPLAGAAMALAGAARRRGATVSVDLSSVSVLEAFGPAAMRAVLARVDPDVVLATAEEAACVGLPDAGGAPLVDGRQGRRPARARRRARRRRRRRCRCRPWPAWSTPPARATPSPPASCWPTAGGHGRRRGRRPRRHRVRRRRRSPPPAPPWPGSAADAARRPSTPRSPTPSLAGRRRRGPRVDDLLPPRPAQPGQRRRPGALPGRRARRRRRPGRHRRARRRGPRRPRRAEHERVLGPARKTAERDLGVAVAQRWPVGATTVSGALALADAAGVAVFATGGIGGVHRGAELTGDVSADLDAIAHHPVVTVCAGAKAFLDLARTLEELERIGVPVLGWRHDDFPAFYTRSSGLPVPHRVETAAEVAAVLAHRPRPDTGVLVAVPIPDGRRARRRVARPAPSPTPWPRPPPPASSAPPSPRSCWAGSPTPPPVAACPPTWPWPSTTPRVAGRDRRGRGGGKSLIAVSYVLQRNDQEVRST